tara:strand:- start:47 stop:646 length:600 start_codon:yes stop_codon:yes gene_type:complete
MQYEKYLKSALQVLPIEELKLRTQEMNVLLDTTETKMRAEYAKNYDQERHKENQLVHRRLVVALEYANQRIEELKQSTNQVEPTLWDSIGGKTGRNHPETSQQAGRKVKSGTQKHQILRLLYAHREGMTAYEMRGRILNGAGDPISTNQIATRLLELRESSMVEFVRNDITGVVLERETTPNNTGQVQRASQWGIHNAI